VVECINRKRRKAGTLPPLRERGGHYSEEEPEINRFVWETPIRRYLPLTAALGFAYSARPLTRLMIIN